MVDGVQSGIDIELSDVDPEEDGDGDVRKEGVNIDDSDADDDKANLPPAKRSRLSPSNAVDVMLVRSDAFECLVC